MPSLEIRSHPGGKKKRLCAFGGITDDNYALLILYWHPETSVTPGWLCSCRLLLMKWNKLISNWINLTAMAGWHASHVAWIMDAYFKSHSSPRHQFLTTVPESIMPGRNFKVPDVHLPRFPAEFPLQCIWHPLKISYQMHHSFEYNRTYLWKWSIINDTSLKKVWMEMENSPILKVVTDIKTKRSTPFSGLHL